MTGRSSRGHGIRPSVSGRDRTEATHQGCESVFGGCESALHKVGELVEGRTGANTCRASETRRLSSKILLAFSQNERDSECRDRAQQGLQHCVSREPSGLR